MRAQRLTGHRLRRLVLSAIAALAAPTLPAAARAAAAGVPLPAGGVASDNTSVRTIACPAAGDCAAAGVYTDSSGVQQALLLNQSGGAWTATRGDLTALPAPYGGPTYKDLYIAAIACPAAGNCVAVGDRTDSTEATDPVIEAEAGGQWLPAAAGELPAGGLSSGYGDGANLDAVACTSPGNCTAVGNYADGSNTDYHPLVITEVNGSWERGIDPGLPSGATSSPGTQIEAVSCASAGNCAAVGSYSNSAGRQGLLLTETDGSWTASTLSTAGLGYAAATNPNVLMSSVTCPAAGRCVAVGSYDTSDATAGVVATESNGSWTATAPDLGQIGYTSGDRLELESVSCAAVASCTAVGYLGTADTTTGVVLAQSGGSWQPSFQGPPAGSSTQPLYYTFLHSASCAQPICAGAGFADDVATGKAVAVILGGPGSSWPYATIPLDAPDPTAETGDDENLISCSTSGYCALAGSYASVADASGATEQQTLLLYAPGPSQAITATAGVGQASVGWQAPADSGGLPVTGYTITAQDSTDAARGGQTVTTGASGTSAQFTGLTPGDSYTFTVTASSLLGSGASASSSGVTVAAATPAPGSAQILATLKRILRPTGKNATRKKVVRNNGFTFKYGALEAGRLVIAWSYVTHRERGRGKHRHRVKVSTLVARASLQITGAQTVNAKVKLTRAGRRLLRAHKRLKLISQISFTPAGGKPIKITGTFTVH